MRSKALRGSILRFSHIRNIWKYGGRSCFCMNVLSILQNDEKLAFGDWKSYSHWLGNCSDSSSMAHLATYVNMLKIAILANFLRLRKASIDHYFSVIIFISPEFSKSQRWSPMQYFSVLFNYVYLDFFSLVQYCLV